MSSKIEIINRALTGSGEYPLSDLTGSTASHQVAAEHYEPIVGELLSEHAWRFATTTRDLGVRQAGDLTSRFLYAYSKPGDALLIEDVRTKDYPVDYEIAGDKILTNAETGAYAVIRYRPDEADWPFYFQNLVYLHLKAIFYESLAQDYGEADAARREAERARAKARATDRRQNPLSYSRESDLAMARRGLWVERDIITRR